MTGENTTAPKRDVQRELAGDYFTDPAFDSRGYFAERLRKRRKGETVWMARTFDSDSGIIYDLYVDDKPVGRVEEDFGYGFDVYKGQIAITENPVPIEEAVALLEAEFQITPSA